jgi:predicted flap endonuclease-1-like 5' DNA nuclease/chromosome segregation ATPase
MFQLPLDTPWVWAWLGAAGLLGLLFGVLLGGAGKRRLRRERTRLHETMNVESTLRAAADGERAAAEAQASRLQEELDETRTALADADREIGTLRSSVDAAETRIAHLEGEVRLAAESAVDENGSLQAELAETTARAESLRTALSAAEVDRDLRVAAAESEAQAALSRAAALEEAVIRLEEEAERDGHQPAGGAESEGERLTLHPEGDADPDSLRARLEDAEETVKALRDRLAEAEAMLEAAAAAPAADPGAERAEQHLIRELQSQLEALAGVEDRLTARQAELGELRRAQSAVVAAKDGEIRSLRARIEQLERTPPPAPAPPRPEIIAELESTRAELSATQQRAEHWERTATALRAQSAGMDEERRQFQSLQVRLDEASQRIEELESDLEEAHRRLAEMESAAGESGTRSAPGMPESSGGDNGAAAPDVRAAAGMDTALEELRGALGDKEARIAYLADRVARLEAHFSSGRIQTPPVTPREMPAEPAPDPTPVDPDDLTRIWGIGPAIARRLNAAGITSFEALAALTPDGASRLGATLGKFLDRFEADEWVGQARRLIEAGDSNPRPADGGARFDDGNALRPGRRDDLTLISGIGPSIERTLRYLGIDTFAQIAAWTPGDIAEIGEALVVFPGRIERERWVEQARGLAARG